jgi:hypothetical protein
MPSSGADHILPRRFVGVPNLLGKFCYVLNLCFHLLPGFLVLDANLLSRLILLLLVLRLRSQDVALGLPLLGKILLECHDAPPFTHAQV